MMTATKSPTERRIDSIAARQRAADEYSDETKVPLQMVPSGSPSSRYRIVRAS